MESLIEFLSSHSVHAHWFILIGLLLAGCNLPISIDVLVILSAIFATQFVPENTTLLYLFLLIGCTLSAWISYTLGRTVGHTLSRWKLFRSILSEKRISSLQKFYRKHGAWAFLVGRFIPFGIRNCIFMSSGLSKMPFLRFALQEFIACFVWVTTCFFVFYHIGQNVEVIWTAVKKINVLIFTVFSIAGISVIWYKQIHKKQKNREENRH